MQCCRTWILLTHINCLTSMAFHLLVPGVGSATAIAAAQEVRYENGTKDDTATYGNPWSDESLTTASVASPIETGFRPRASSTDSERGNQAQEDSHETLALPRRMCFARISKKFVAVRSFHVQASALGRAVLATVFLATSLLAVASLFAMVVFFCRGCRAKKNEDNPPTVEAPPPAYASSKGGPFGGIHCVPIDPPPPYRSASQSTNMDVQSATRVSSCCLPVVETRTVTQAPSQDEDQPPTYDAILSSSRRPEIKVELTPE